MITSMTGHFSHTIDEKERLVLPKQYRGNFESGVVLLPRDGYVACYPVESWNVTADRVRREFREQRLTQDDKIRIFTNATQTVMDGQGRVKMSDTSLGVLGDARDVTVGGADDFLAISPATANASNGSSVEELLRAVGL